MTNTEQFAALPVPIQDQLIRIARLAAGMSTDEKEAARFLIAGMSLQFALDLPDVAIEAGEMIAACGRIVQFADEASGSSASGLVV
jgi:hypothetical protein